MIRVVRLGSPRARGEGLRIGTVRRPPRGVKKDDFASRDFYDVWYPVLAPSPDLVAGAQAAQKAGSREDWAAFTRAYRREMSRADAVRGLELLAALSHQTNLSVGCYCEDEVWCHRSVLRELLTEIGAEIESG